MRLEFSMESTKNTTYSHKLTALLSCSRIHAFVKLYTRYVVQNLQSVIIF